MNSLKLSSLHSLALHCGFPTATTKAARLACIANYDDYFLALGKPRPLSILSVDVGLKNFSYCYNSYSSLSLPTAEILQWNHVNLHEKFGVDYQPKTRDPDSLVDSKAYIAHIAVNVVDKILLAHKNPPNIIMIENQRTRSNGNTSTLPNVLLNFTLENMLYSALTAKGASVSTEVIPVNASKMVNFWIGRFTGRSTKITSAKSKVLRTQLLYGWLSNPKYSPYKFAGLLSKLPTNLSGLSTRAKTSLVLDQLSFETRPKKVDDLVDCLLYNLMCVLQLRRHSELKKAILKDEDIAELISKWDADHCLYLQPLIKSAGLELASDYL